MTEDEVLVSFELRRHQIRSEEEARDAKRAKKFHDTWLEFRDACGGAEVFETVSAGCDVMLVLSQGLLASKLVHRALALVAALGKDRRLVPAT